jgi:hypothetical protein
LSSKFDSSEAIDAVFSVLLESIVGTGIAFVIVEIEVAQLLPPVSVLKTEKITRREQGEKVMKLLNKALAFSLLTASVVMAQPMYDVITVTLPYPVKVRDAVLPPGDYEIKQDASPTNNRVLHFYSDKGMKFETTAMAIPALDNKTPSETSLLLDRYGSDYYLNKIWVQGKDYGYEFPIPDSVKSRENERTATTVPAKFQPSPTPAPAAEATPAPVAETAQNNPPPSPAPVAAEPVRTPEPIAQPAPVEMAQNTPPAPPAPDLTPAPAADTENRTPSMPSTSADWLNLILGGGALSGIGVMLRRAKA